MPQSQSGVQHLGKQKFIINNITFYLKHTMSKNPPKQQTGIQPSYYQLKLCLNEIVSMTFFQASFTLVDKMFHNKALTKKIQHQFLDCSAFQNIMYLRDFIRQGGKNRFGGTGTKGV